MAAASDFGDGSHRALQGTTGFSHHGVVTEMEIQCLHNVGRVITAALIQRENVLQTLKNIYKYKKTNTSERKQG